MLPSRPLRFLRFSRGPSTRDSGRCGAFLAAVLSLGFLLAIPRITPAQTGERPLITQAVDNKQLVTLRGNTHPLARAEFDRGPAPATLPMERMLLVLGRSAGQEAALQTLLEQQQYKASPSFHKWLTPQEFGQEFGASEPDIETITAWLEAQGFAVSGVSNGRTVIEFSGTAAKVEQAFHTAIHRYVVGGKQHWANTSDPQIPSALAPVVVGVDSLNNFARKAQHHPIGPTARKVTAGVTEAKPELTYMCGVNQSDETVYCNLLAPYDFATIYNVLPLWNAGTPIDGTGESIALIGRSNINLQDVANFRSLFGLPANTPQVILDGPDPGITPDDDETEADLDVEWAGAVAKGATIKLVVSESTETTDGVDLSAEYAVDNNVAPIISESFGNCELALGAAGNEFYNNLWEQASAEGISVFVSAGDSGSAGCDRYEGSAPEPAGYGLAVNGIASTPYNVSVGGTDFNDLFNAQTYWNTTNNPTTQQSAIGYIPETAWNDSCTNAIFAQLGWESTALANCNISNLSPYVITLGGSGGQSTCTTSNGSTPSSCAGGYAKPPWQAGDGVPADGTRDVPDVSLFASNGFLDTAYALCETDQPYGYCGSSTSVLGIGGTSASSPTFAALMALVDQKTGSAQGNPNFIFYKLAAQTPASTCNSSTGPASACVFNDVTSGTIAMPCRLGSLNCTGAGAQYGILSGYNAGSGYDLATGLGSVNANHLVNDWNSVTFTPSTTTLTLDGGNTVNVVHGSQISVGVSVSPTSPEPTGNVALMAVEGSHSYPFDTLTLANGSASGTTNMLPGGSSYTVEAHYAGDGNYGGSNSTPVTVTVTPESSKTALRMLTFDPTSGQLTNANATTVVYGSPYLLRADVTNSSGTDCLASGSAPTYACPTGTVGLTDNGNALGASAFALNSQGYTEDQTVQLTGGAHNLVANYSGDSSYNASSAGAAVTVTPAATTTSLVAPVETTPPEKVVLGIPMDISEDTQAQSSGVVPTGTFTIYDGGKQILSQSVGGAFHPSADTVAIEEEIPLSLSAVSGPHTLTITYSGDANYGSSTSAAVTVDAVYPVTMTAAASPASILYNAGTPVTVTATVGTGNPATNAGLEPTGTFTFVSNVTGAMTNPVTTTATRDANGNWELQGTMTFAPSQTQSVSVNYSGDSNYNSYINAYAQVSVTIPDFNLSPGSAPLAITAGQSGTATLTITPTTSYASTVQLSCGNTMPGATCTISPSSVTLSNGTAATATLTISTTAPSSVSNARTVLARMRPAAFIPFGRDSWWSLSLLTGWAALLLVVLPGRRRCLRAAAGLAFICVASLAVGCGGGASASGNGGGNSGPYSTTTTITASSTKVAQGANLTLTSTVSSSASAAPTGSIVFNFGGCNFAPSENLTNGSAQWQMVGGYLGTAICGVATQYAGFGNSLPSTSGTLNIAFTGSFAQNIVGQTGSDMHTAQVTFTLQ